MEVKIQADFGEKVDNVCVALFERSSCLAVEETMREDGLGVGRRRRKRRRKRRRRRWRRRGGGGGGERGGGGGGQRKEEEKKRRKRLR